jgi:hypothetical protein
MSGMLILLGLELCGMRVIVAGGTPCGARDTAGFSLRPNVESSPWSHPSALLRAGSGTEKKSSLRTLFELLAKCCQLLSHFCDFLFQICDFVFELGDAIIGGRRTGRCARGRRLGWRRVGEEMQVAGFFGSGLARQHGYQRGFTLA